MKRIAISLFTLIATTAQLSSVWASPAATVRVAQTSAGSAAFSAGSLSGYVQAKGSRPDSAIAGAVRTKLLNEYTKAVPNHATAITADVVGLAGLLPSKNPAISGLMSVGQNNSVLLNGLTAGK